MIEHRIFDSLNVSYIQDNISFMDLCIENAVESKNEELADILSLLINNIEESHLTAYNHTFFIQDLKDSLEYIEFYETELKGLVQSFIVKAIMTNQKTIALN